MALKAQTCALDFSNSCWASVSPHGNLPLPSFVFLADILNSRKIAKSLVRRLLSVDPRIRYDVSECFAHPWVSSQRALLEDIYERKIINGWVPPSEQRQILSASQSAAFFCI